MTPLKCLVACLSAEGVPSLFPVIVECSEKEKEEGLHVEVACWACERAGCEFGEVVFDEATGPDHLFENTDWELAVFVPAFVSEHLSAQGV